MDPKIILTEAISPSSVLPLAFVAVLFFVHLSFAVYVARDCRDVRYLRRRSFGGGPFVWFFATLIGGVLTLGIYWMIHHSSLRPEDPRQRARERAQRSTPAPVHREPV